MQKTGLIIFGLILTLIVSLHAAGVIRLAYLDNLERQAYDYRLHLSRKKEPDPRVIIIDLDEESLSREGQWPWPREKVANMVNQLFDQYNIGTLGFDVVFAEPETSFTNQKVRQMLQQQQQGRVFTEDDLMQESGDQKLAASFRNRSIVLGYVFEAFEQKDKVPSSVGLLPDPLFGQSKHRKSVLIQETKAPVADRFTANIEELHNAVNKAGFFSLNEMEDPDGIIRRVGVLNEFDKSLYGSLALELVQSYLKVTAEPVIPDVSARDGYAAFEALSVRNKEIPLDAQAAVYVPYLEPKGSYRYIPAWKVLNGTVEQDIANTIAIVGTSAAGLVDLRNTPFSPSFPGVEVHANVVSAMLDGNFRVKPNWVTGVNVIIIAAIGILLACLLPSLSALWATLVFAITSLVVIQLNWYFWSSQMFILPIAPLLKLIVSLYLLNMIAGFFIESQSRRLMQQMFGLYIPPEVVDEMSTKKDVYSLKSQKRELTVLFADVRDFTSISENMLPETLSELLNTFLTPMTKIIHKHGGAIDKYMGDAVMAFWGAPVATNQHASKAVAAALEMIDALDDINVKFKEKGWPELRIGIGINTGMMSVGNMGSEFRMAYTVLGDAVNLGSRLESLTKQYKVPVIISEYTARQATEYKYKRLDQVKVKGKEIPVTIFSCAGLKGEGDDDIDNDNGGGNQGDDGPSFTPEKTMRGFPV